MRVFIGKDRRQPVSAAVLAHSIDRRATRPVSISNINIHQLPLTRRGLTDFTYARYMVPWMCDYEGWALFLDADILCKCDIWEIMDYAQDDVAVQVVKSKLRFEWPAVMLFNNRLCKNLTPEYIEDENNHPQDFAWGDVGELPKAFHQIVNYDEPAPDAKILHYTMGVPLFKEVCPCEGERDWLAEREMMNYSVSWLELMGKSVHAPAVFNRWGV